MLTVLLILAAFLRFANLTQNGHGNLYYAAAVRSMLESWHNFLYAAYDPAGFLSVDKPPVALWVQTLSAKLFGFSGGSLIVPQGIFGLLTLLLLYFMARPVFGRVAALVTAGVYAIMPITVAVERVNLPDPLLTFTLTLAAYLTLKATTTEKPYYFWLSAACLGLGFHIKMWEAWVLIPTLIGILVNSEGNRQRQQGRREKTQSEDSGKKEEERSEKREDPERGLRVPSGCQDSGYPLGVRTQNSTRENPTPNTQNLPHRTWFFLTSLFCLLLTSFAWVAFVDLTPAENRPYVGGSTNNSLTQLIFGYNGIERILGGKNQLEPRLMLPGGPLEVLNNWVGFSAGQPGLTRFFQKPLAAQILWWLPLSMVGLWLAWEARKTLRREERALVLLGAGWLFSFWLVFSFAGGTVHPYYISAMTPAFALLAGSAVALIRRSEEARFFQLVALVGTALYQGSLVFRYPDAGWLPWVGIGGAVGVGVGHWVLGQKRETKKEGAVVWSFLLSFLLIAPLRWAATAVQYPVSGLFPYTGPEIAKPGNGPPPSLPEPAIDRLLQYLTLNYRNERFLLATASVYNASPLIIRTGKPVMAFGGFLGGDPILTPQSLQTIVNKGEVRFVLFSSGDGLPGNTYLPPLFRWTQEHCRVVDPHTWQYFVPNYGMETMTLFDCQKIQIDSSEE